jgi:hypothetical protein
MGWLEVLAMLKRMMPLLTRLAPMLESYVGGRIAGRDEAAALERVASGLKQDLISTTAAHRTETEAALARQTAHLRELSEDLQELRMSQEESANKLEAVQVRLSAIQSTLRLLVAGMGLVLALLITVAVVLLLRR